MSPVDILACCCSVLAAAALAAVCVAWRYRQRWLAAEQTRRAKDREAKDAVISAYALARQQLIARLVRAGAATPDERKEWGSWMRAKQLAAKAQDVDANGRVA